MPDAGMYRYRLKRQSPIPSNEGQTGYRDTGEIWYAMITDTKSAESQEQGTAVFDTQVMIRIRNMVDIAANDRLLDTATSEIYHVLGVMKNWQGNETVVLAERRQFAMVV